MLFFEAINPFALNFGIVTRLLAIILFMSLSFQSMVKLGIVAWYQVNKTYVATVLCENKDKPEMNCCGKCYVRKQLNKADDNGSSEKQTPVKGPHFETVDYVMPVFTATRITLSTASVSKVFNGRYTGSLGFDIVSSIFHPPPTC